MTKENTEKNKDSVDRGVEIVLTGRVYDEPEKPMADNYPNWIKFILTVATKWTDDEGKERESITWYKCHSSREERTNFINKKIRKGMLVSVRGIPRTCAYIDQEGKPGAQVEVTLTIDPMILTMKDVVVLNKIKELDEQINQVGLRAELSLGSNLQKVKQSLQHNTTKKLD
ncbi:MAG: single-stranded DNA-binding protein [Rickettsiaceae bacterium]